MELKKSTPLKLIDRYFDSWYVCQIITSNQKMCKLEEVERDVQQDHVPNFKKQITVILLISTPSTSQSEYCKHMQFL